MTAALDIDHVGVQVRDLESAATLFEEVFGYQRATRPVVNTRHGVRGLFLVRDGSPTIKLISPTDLATGGQRFGAHHLAFLTDDIDAAVTELRSRGARLISPPQPGEMFDDNLIAFLFLAGLNIELVTTRAWRDRIISEEAPV